MVASLAEAARKKENLLSKRSVNSTGRKAGKAEEAGPADEALRDRTPTQQGSALLSLLLPLWEKGYTVQLTKDIIYLSHTYASG